MRTAILLLNFGEPEHATVEEVVPFLERIFMINMSLEGKEGAEAQGRAHELAEMRAPGLIEEYELIGGSPLHAQAAAQGEQLEQELERRGHDVVVILGMQFTPPSIADAVRRARELDAVRIVALPVYPLCGPSTTIAALDEVERELRRQQWDVPVRHITGWHRHPDYLAFRADAIRRVLRDSGLSFDDPRTRLVFSAHGTPMKYIREGSRYDVYVRDFCADVARRVGASAYDIGYQNHTNRPLEWTQPDVAKVIDAIDADRVVVDPVSFMHEQSETLAELDHELKQQAEARGLAFHRVMIEHAAPAFISVLADLVQPLLHDGEAAQGPAQGMAWQPCRCKAGALCVNAGMAAL